MNTESIVIPRIGYLNHCLNFKVVECLAGRVLTNLNSGLHKSLLGAINCSFEGSIHTPTLIRNLGYEQTG
jgi:hypothetical protein